MSLLTAVLQLPRTPHLHNSDLYDAIESLDRCGLRVLEIKTPNCHIEATVELETDAPIQDDEQAIEAFFAATANLDTDDITILHGHHDGALDDRTSGLNCLEACFAQPCF